MRHLQQYRPFIYRDRDEIDDFLEESELWRKLYMIFLDVKDNAYRLKVPAVNMFNEVRYQCVRVMLDKHPEENIWQNYLNPAYESLGWRYASDLCFAMVYAVLKHIEDAPHHIQLFLKLLNRKMETEENYFPYIDSYFNRLKKVYAIELAPQPEKPDVFRKQLLTYDTSWWAEATSGFDQSRIREIVNLWEEKEEKLAIIDIIKGRFVSWKEEQSQKDDLPF